MSPVEPWVEEALRAKGIWNDDGVSRSARARRCKECAAVILVGLDGDRCGGVARVDLTPLTPLAEALAVSTLDLMTYRLRWSVDHYEIDPRWQWDTEGAPAAPGTVDVLPAHRCGQPVSTLPLARPHQRTTRTVGPDDVPPF